MSETSEKLDHTLRAYGRLERKHGERGRELTAVKVERDAYKAALESVDKAWDAWMMHEDGEGQDGMEEAMAVVRSVLAGVVSTREKDK